MTRQMEIISAIELAGGQSEAILDAIARAGYVCVPRKPTPEMLDAAWGSAIEEHAAGVWRDMIEAHECGITS